MLIDLVAFWLKLDREVEKATKFNWWSFYNIILMVVLSWKYCIVWFNIGGSSVSSSVTAIVTQPQSVIQNVIVTSSPQPVAGSITPSKTMFAVQSSSSQDVWNVDRLEFSPTSSIFKPSTVTTTPGNLGKSSASIIQTGKLQPARAESDATSSPTRSVSSNWVTVTTQPTTHGKVQLWELSVNIFPSTDKVLRACVSTSLAFHC